MWGQYAALMPYPCSVLEGMLGWKRLGTDSWDRHWLYGSVCLMVWIAAFARPTMLVSTLPFDRPSFPPYPIQQTVLPP